MMLMLENDDLVVVIFLDASRIGCMGGFSTLLVAESLEDEIGVVEY